ncbi:MAG: hypothetical protein ACUVQG_04000 [Thermogutta sp.]
MDASSYTTAGQARNPQEVLGRWLSDMAAGQRELASVLDEMFAELITALEEWAKTQAAQETHLRQRETELSQREQLLEHSLAEQRRVQEQLVQLRQQLDARAAELDRQLQTFEKQAAELARRSTEIQQPQQELDSLREVVSQLGSLLSASSVQQPTAAVAESPQIAQLQERIRQLEKELNDAQRQREILETEIEVLRHRAMEWLEMLADQRRQLLDERNRWSSELRQFRRLVEVLLDHHLEALPEQHEEHDSGGQPRVIPYEPLEGRRTGTGDAFLDSLSAQFDQLRRDFDRRRGNSGS